MTVVTETENEPDRPAHRPGRSPRASRPTRPYWMIGGILAPLTLVEVSTYWWPEEWHKVTPSSP